MEVKRPEALRLRKVLAAVGAEVVTEANGPLKEGLEREVQTGGVETKVQWGVEKWPNGLTGGLPKSSHSTA